MVVDFEIKNYNERKQFAIIIPIRDQVIISAVFSDINDKEYDSIHDLYNSSIKKTEINMLNT